MALQFVLGNSGVGKSYAIYQQIIEESRQFPNRNYLVLVPEQFTMQTQKQLVDLHPAKAIMNIDVLSFARLAYRIFGEVGMTSLPVLEETGKSFVLQKIAQEKKKSLGVLGGNMKKPGYINEMKSMISELMQYQVAPSDMTAMIELSDAKPMLKNKLTDIQTIFEGFTTYLKDKNITPEEVLEVASELVAKSDLLKNSTIVLDGFTGFTPVQYGLIKELMHYSQQLYVTATIDQRENLNAPVSYHNLFHMSREMVERLGEFAKASDITIDKPMWINDASKGRFANSPALHFLEQNLFRRNPKQYSNEQNEIHITAMDNPFAECEEVVSQIHQLIKKENFRYKDIAIITGNLETYRELLAPILEREGMPFFADETHSVLMNPFVEYLRSAMDMATSGMSYESVFRYLRSGMSDISNRDIDVLENYVIALGIRGKSKWNETWTRRYRGMDKSAITSINEIREKFLSETLAFTDEFCAKGQTVRERTEHLYRFIVNSEIQAKLEQQKAQFKKLEDGALVKEYDQIYGIVMGLLDKLVEVLGDEKISMADYQQLLEAGFSEAKVGIIPPSADQLVIGDVKRTRLGDIKALFFVGVNEGIIPQKSDKGGVLSELERDFLKNAEVPLSPSAREDMYIQKFYLYQNLTKPARYLYLSYSSASVAGEGVGAAYLIPMIEKIFPLTSIRKVSTSQFDINNIDSATSGLNALPSILRKLAAGEEDMQGLQLLNWFIQNERYREDAKRLLMAAFYENRTDAITKSVAKALYGEVLENNATRLEKFSACAFAHFLQHGLGLAKRAQYEFNNMDMGTVMHAALEQFTSRLQKENLDLKNIDDNQRNGYIDESVEEIMADYGNSIANSSARNKYMVTRIKRIMRRTAWALQSQMQKGDFVPDGVEVSFAMEDQLEAINFALSEDATMRLKGQIDRLDVCETDDKVYVKVIDYKSGNTSLDLTLLYHGLQLQLVVYLNAALEIERKKHEGQEVAPAGIFYYHIDDPLISGNGGEDEQVLKDAILKGLRMNGLVSTDNEAVRHLDNALSEGGSSSVIPVSINKNGSYSSKSKVISEEKFAILSDYVNEKIGEIGQRIMAGEVAVNPYTLGDKNSCTYCDYNGICGFDTRIKGCKSRSLTKIDEDIIWQKMNRGEH